MVKDQLEEVYKANEKTLPKNDAIEVCHPRPKEFTLLTVRLSRETILKGVDFDIITSDDGPSAQDSHITRPIAANSGNKQCLDRVAALLKECQLSHEACKSKCRGPRQPSQLPSRILDVGPFHGPLKIRLLENKGTTQSPYATLSYCWGNPTASRIILTQESMAVLKRGISLESLTPVFRDAITVARHLRIRFVWIDALCILQGSSQDAKQDWAREGKRMGLIYANATLNIVASCSPDSNTPFLCDRSKVEDDLRLPYYSRKKRNQGFLSFRSPQSTRRLVKEHLIQPVQTRAWCFQERIVSRRSIFFDESQFLWECNEGYILEDRPSIVDLIRVNFVPHKHEFPTYSDSLRLGGFHARNLLPYSKTKEHRLSLGVTAFNHKEVDETLGTDDVLAEHWYQRLYEFSLRKLTYPEDALPAISAIAKHDSQPGDTYLAGIWQSDLHHGLLWTYSGSLAVGETVRRAAGSPSWSWASLYNKSGYLLDTVSIQYRLRVPDQQRDAVLLRADMKPLFEDPYGQMKYAALEIRGLTRRVTPVTRSFPFKSRFLPSLRLEEPVSGLVGEARLDPDFDFDKYRLNLDGQSVNKTTGLLALLLGRWDTGFPFDPPVLRGLLLEHADDGQRYERRGTFTIKPPPLRTGEHGRVSCCYEQESRWDENVNSESIKKGFDGTWEGWRTETVVII